MPGVPAISSWLVRWPRQSSTQSPRGHANRRRDHLFGLLGFFNLAITAHRALRQYVSPDLPVAKATAMSRSLGASGDPVAIFIFLLLRSRVPDEARQLTRGEYGVSCRRNISCSRRMQLDCQILCIPEYFPPPSAALFNCRHDLQLPQAELYGLSPRRPMRAEDVRDFGHGSAPRVTSCADSPADW